MFFLKLFNIYELIKLMNVNYVLSIQYSVDDYINLKLYKYICKI